MLNAMDSGVFLADLGKFPSYVSGRRQCLAGIELRDEAMRCYNHTLQQVCPQARGVHADQIASAGRRLLEAAMTGRSDGYVERRMASVGTLARMRTDGDWRLRAGLAPRIGALLDYVDEPDDLIPDDTPIVGQFDDAILVDLLLRDIAGDVADYDDFCWYRRELAARLHADPDSVHVELDDWLAARQRAFVQARARQRQAYARAAGFATFRVV